MLIQKPKAHIRHPLHWLPIDIPAATEQQGNREGDEGVAWVEVRVGREGSDVYTEGVALAAVTWPGCLTGCPQERQVLSRCRAPQG